MCQCPIGPNFISTHLHMTTSTKHCPVSMPYRAKLHFYNNDNKGNKNNTPCVNALSGQTSFLRIFVEFPEDKEDCVNALSGQTSFLPTSFKGGQYYVKSVNALSGQTSFLRNGRGNKTRRSGCVNALSGQTSFLLR